MKISSKIILIPFLLICCTSNIFSQTITFTFNLSEQDIINQLVGNSVVISNVTGSTSPNSRATFTGGTAANIGINSGIILSTGNFNNFSGTSNTLLSIDIGAIGDPDLDILTAPYPTMDAQAISFDFKVASDSVEFDFVFASEEYNEYVNSAFNDVFAFFVTGPGYANNTNVALIPGTSVPITINSVNNGSSSSTATGPCTNCSYYTDNVGLNPVQVSYDGLTTVIKIKFAVWPCTDYNFKIAIADVSDRILDSAVLLGENTFIACPLIQVTNKGSVAPATLNLCSGGIVTLTAPEGANYLWSNGETTQAITVTQPGTYSCIYTDGTCFATTDNVNVVQQGSIQTPAISQLGQILVSNIIPAPGITFQWYLDGNMIPGAVNEDLPLQGNGCYQLFIYEGGCEASSNIECITNTSIYELYSGNFSIAPHPVIDNSVIKTSFTYGSITTLKLYDITGKIVFEQVYEGGNDIILESKLFEGGFYLIELNNSFHKETVNGKVVILK